ncbi:unnamed protein product [Cyprideis torosa]|uniref:Choline transporter-like protein n=1 Tax=Cyprideis torosa TaxID=163714 RepID=A0A7R8ZIS4_9CRUS|nr:unnamed protein product [Cyprideis torosa]CAG0886862.1 unnamed protein product [Cyprideis torosa]
MPSRIGDVGERKKFDYDPSFEGPTRKRSCTDIICLLLFIVCVALWILVLVAGLYYGDPDNLIYPTDSHGNLCGRDAGFENRSKLFFFDLTKCAKPSVVYQGCKTPQVCVESCPKELFIPELNGNDAEIRSRLICKDGTNPLDTSMTWEELIKQELCARYYLISSDALGRCLPSIKGKKRATERLQTSGQEEEVAEERVKMLFEGSKNVWRLIEFQQLGMKVFQDFRATWWMILVGLLIGAVTSFIWICLLQFIAWFMVWLSILGVLGLLGFATYYSFATYVDLKDEINSNISLSEIGFTTNVDTYLALQETWLVFGCICAAVLVVVFLILLFLRSRIALAIQLIKYGSKAIGDILTTLIFPISTYLGQLVVISLFILMAVYLASVGDSSFRVSGLDDPNDSDCTGCEGLTNNMTCNPLKFKCECSSSSTQNPDCMFFEYGGNNWVARLQIFNLFMFFWAMCFVSDLGDMVLAGKYHLGTLAFGSLLIAIIKMIRVTLEYIDRKIKEYGDSSIARCMICFCKCCMWCLEKFIRFLNLNAYIMCAIHGKNFCRSAKDAFLLLMRNAARVIVLDKVTDFLLFIGKLVIVGAVGVASFYVFDSRIEFLDGVVPRTNYYMVPVFTVVIGTYFIASAFFAVYEMAVDTLFLSFLEDLERNDGSAEKPYLMPKGLMKLLGKRNASPKMEGVEEPPPDY